MSTSQQSPTSLEMAEGFFSRRFSTFIEAARQHDPRWVLLGDDSEAIRYEQEPWRGREHRVWMCLLVAAATGELKSRRETSSSLAAQPRKSDHRIIRKTTARLRT